ncbi:MULTISPECIES: hypothetical protein [unclassified Caulobacter]|uniref:hypothetical protein n=1 Tax=Caulobacter sp. 3R27C2-B TaxID=2502219 RepID=UPI00143D2195|nr:MULTISPECIES: hypothetical protein [unclassified Caulobacter]
MAKAHFVAHDVLQGRGAGNRERDLAPDQFATSRHLDRARQILHFEGLGLNAEPFGLQLDNVQNVIEQASQRSPRQADHLDLFPGGRIQNRPREHVGACNNAIHGRAHFVAHVRQEGAFGLAGSLGGLERMLQGFGLRQTFGDVLG